MQLLYATLAFLAFGATSVTAAPYRATNLTLSKPSKPLLNFDQPLPATPQLKYAFTAKIDWDLDNNHTIATPSGLRCSWWAREGYWFNSTGHLFGQILRANDDGMIPPNTNHLELAIYYVVQLDDGYWAYVTHTGSAVLRSYQHGRVRIETASPRYSYLNLIDLVAPGTFNGTEVMTAHHYFPDSETAPI